MASCQELARLNDFPTRAIEPDNKHDMALRERKRKELAIEKEKFKQQRSQAANKSKMKNNDSALLLQEISKKKKRGEDLDESDLDKLKKDNKSEAKSNASEEDDATCSVLPKWVKFPVSDDEFYPAEFEKTVYDCYNLKVVFDREKTGFEETKDFPIVINSIIAGRY